MYPSYYLAIDVVIFRSVEVENNNYKKVNDRQIEVLLVKRDLDPYKGQLSLPGGFLGPEETLEETAKKKLKEKLNIEDIYIEQLYTFSNPKRDITRDKRVISCSYLALCNTDDNLDIQSGFNVGGFEWVEVSKALEFDLAFDHKEILTYAIDRLKNKVNYTDISLHLMPEKFTMAQYRKTIEAIEGREIFRMEFKRNFEKYLESTEEMSSGLGHKAARLMKKKEG